MGYGSPQGQLRFQFGSLRGRVAGDLWARLRLRADIGREVERVHIACPRGVRALYGRFPDARVEV